MIKRILIFLVLNFGALALGGFFTGTGVISDWYFTLNKAPWTPPGWVFGAAWTSIMFLFSLYMSFLWPRVEDRKSLIMLFSIQWILNVAWNPVFFYFQQIGIGLVVILLLTALVGFFLFRFRRLMSFKTIFIAPYFIWLLIASSLNIYLFLYN
jgi:benzodiazapine receptor